MDASRIELPDEAIVAVLRTKTPAERLAMAFAANRTMRQRLEGHFRTHHPEWPVELISAEIAARMQRGTM